MPDLVYGPAAIEQARVSVAAHARRIPALADLLGPGVDPAAGLDAGAVLAGALADLRTALEGELTAGGARLDEADRALDATLRAVQGVDAEVAASLRGSGDPEDVGSLSRAGVGALAELR